MDNHAPGAERFALCSCTGLLYKTFVLLILASCCSVTCFSRISLLSVELTLGYIYCFLAATCKTPLRCVENLVRFRLESQYQEERSHGTQRPKARVHEALRLCWECVDPGEAHRYEPAAVEIHQREMNEQAMQ